MPVICNGCGDSTKRRCGREHAHHALFAHVPLSECRHIVRLHQRMRQPSDYAARVHIYAHYCERALAAVSNQLKLVTAELDELRREMDAMTGEL